jgi:hemerythrin superfamily protein
MDALDLLYSDHTRIRNLFAQLANAENTRQRRAIFAKIRAEFLTHSEIEEKIFYPPFRRYDDHQSLLNDFYDAHAKARTLILETEKERDEQKFNQAVRSVVDAISTHIEDEHKHFFPIVRRLMKRAERDQLGRHLEAARNERRKAA